MALTLDFNDQLLICERYDVAKAAVTFTDNSSVMIKTGTRMVSPNRSKRAGSRIAVIRFVVEIGSLPEQLQGRIRGNINRRQQTIHDEAPEFKYDRPRDGGGLIPNRIPGKASPKRRQPKLVPAERPPASIDIPDTYELVIHTHATYNNMPALRVGRELTFSGDKPFNEKKYMLGTIAGFTLL